MYWLRTCLLTAILTISKAVASCYGDNRCDILRQSVRETMILDENQVPEHLKARVSRAGIEWEEDKIKEYKIWPVGLISYYIDPFSFDSSSIKNLRETLTAFAGVTGLRFEELSKIPSEDDQQRYVLFINRQGKLECEDLTTQDFTAEGVQKAVIGYDCLSTRERMTPSLLALVGVPPQHNAPNRDKYIEVNFTNIIDEYKYLFTKLKNWPFDKLYKDYDYLSAGHYDFLKHTANGKATITAIREIPENVKLLVGLEKGFSDDDLLKISILYQNENDKRAAATSKKACGKLFVDVSSKLKKEKKKNNFKEEFENIADYMSEY